MADEPNDPPIGTAQNAADVARKAELEAHETILARIAKANALEAQAEAERDGPEDQWRDRNVRALFYGSRRAYEAWRIGCPETDPPAVANGDLPMYEGLKRNA